MEHCKNKWIGSVLGLACSLLLFASVPVEGTEGAVPDTPNLDVADQVSSAKEIIGNMCQLPAAPQRSVDALLAVLTETNATFVPDSVTSLVEFVQSACREDSGWKLPPRDGADGAGYVVKIKVPIQHYIEINAHPGIPDYTIFPASLRYSTFLDSKEMRHAYGCINVAPTGSQMCVTRSFYSTEEITPNPESGSYFSYTNSRILMRGKVLDRDVFFSFAQMVSPSTFSCRGLPIGPSGEALFYYSEKPGLNLFGMTWVLSQINRSTTLSVYVSLASNETAVASFAWLNAGWKGINVIRPHHILNTQKATLDFSRRIAQSPDVSAERIAAIVATVESMSPEAVAADYAKYLDYVRACRDRGKKGMLNRSGLLKDLYDDQTAEAAACPYQRALLVQERLRVLLGTPTWSAD